MLQAMLRLCRYLYHPWRMAILATLLSALLLALGSLGLALYQAGKIEREELGVRGERFLQRIEQVFGQLRRALDQLESQPWRQCNQAMLDQLERVSFSHRFILEAAFIEGEQRCSSGPQQVALQPLPLREPDVQGPPHRYWLNTATEPDDDLAALVIARGPFHVSTSRGHLRDAVDLSDGAGLYLIPLGSSQALPILGATQPLSLVPGERDRQDPDGLDLLGEQLVYRLPGDIPSYQLALVTPRAKLNRRIRETWVDWLPGCLLLALLAGGGTYLQVRSRQSLKSELQGALKRHELLVHYQPIFDLASRRCIGAEALVRWQRPDGSLTSPELFIPLAESSGQIRQITDFMLQRVFEQLADLLRSHPELYISINLAACDVSVPRIGTLTRSLLARHRVRSEQIAFEITERGLIDLPAARSHLAELRARGHRVLIDDFGTGYANLAYLQELPVDCLKIDKAFIARLSTDAAGHGVAHHIIRMAKALQIKVIAEGVEHEEQARLLGREGAEFGQGWLFARPLTAYRFRELIRNEFQAASVERVA